MSFLDLSLGAFLAFAATSAGAAVVLRFRNISGRAYAAILAFSSGVMAFAAGEMLLQSSAASGDLISLAGLACGLCLFVALDHLLPHAHALINRSAGELPRHKRKAVLLAGTITLHNIPEGLAIASAFAASPSLGWLVATSIAVQDFPEGFIVSTPLSVYGVKTSHSFLWGAFSGLVEFMAAIAGFLFLSSIQGLTQFALAFSAGAMAYVTAFELLPDAFSGREKLVPTLLFAFGILSALALSIFFTP